MILNSQVAPMLMRYLGHFRHAFMSFVSPRFVHGAERSFHINFVWNNVDCTMAITYRTTKRWGLRGGPSGYYLLQSDNNVRRNNTGSYCNEVPHRVHLFQSPNNDSIHRRHGFAFANAILPTSIRGIPLSNYSSRLGWSSTPSLIIRLAPPGKTSSPG